MPRDLLDQVGLARDVVAARSAARVDARGRRRPRLDREAERARGSRRCARAGSSRAEQAARPARRAARIDCGAGTLGAPTSIVPGTSVAPPARPSARVATAWASSASSGRSSSRSAPRPRCAGRASARCGGCSARSRSRPPAARASSPSETSRALAAHDPGDRRSGRRRRRPRTHLGVERALDAVERRHLLAVASRGGRSSAPPATRSRSKACSGWPVSSIT